MNTHPAMRKDFPVVCVGGSAGGLDAYIRLLKNLPADLGVAIVIVNHMTRFPTQMHEILPKYTTMPVDLISDRLLIEPNRVFIIPENRDLHAEGGEFQLRPISKPRGWPDVITVFLRSLTAHWDGKLIAVIVSGYDGDGAAALCGIQQVGGITIAQKPETAKQPDMPESAIASGCIDFVLAPEDIAVAIRRIAQQEAQARGPKPAASRTERDSFGPIEVPADALWGAQTQRSLRYFAIGEQRMPMALVHALAQIKRAAAEVNQALGLLAADKAQAIAAAAARVASGEFDAEFPLSVWQTGSGTQTHMNVNEVVAHLASLALGSSLAGAHEVHPNDDVNLGQSSNDAFPTAMHVAVVLACGQLLQSLGHLRLMLEGKAAKFADTLKVGRTHLQDATPVTLGQEFGAYAAQLGLAEAALGHSLAAVHALAIGGTAVGTGINTHPEFGRRVAQVLADRLGAPFTVATNLFAAMAGHEALVGLHGALRLLAIALNKIANDIRLMGSGPRAGLGELRLPENEPGSSIMPGKVNPTQVEALAMVCAQVMGHDVAIGIAAGQGQFELNVYKPLIALDVLDSIRLLRDAMTSFAMHCVQGIEADTERMNDLLQRSLMLVTALTPHIGYDRAAHIAKDAHSRGSTLRDAALASGEVSAADFDAWVRPADMVGGPVR